MAKASLNDADKYKGGSSFFKLEDGDKKIVRFLYNNVSEVIDSAIVVHEYSGNNFATIDCARTNPDESIDMCKWCAQGNVAVMRVILPIYDEETQSISYWKKSASFVRDNLIPLFENLPENVPISGQQFIISRTGKTMRDTKYQVAPNMKVMNDSKTKDQFGEIKDPFDMNMVRPADCDYDPNASSTTASAEPTQATRRTTDVF